MMAEDSIDYDHGVVKLAFTPRNEELVLLGHKFATTRRSEHGKVGSIFSVRGRWYEIQAVFPTTLGGARRLFYLEGYREPDEFLGEWASCYNLQIGQLDRASPVYVHIFHFVPGQLAGRVNLLLGAPR